MKTLALLLALFMSFNFSHGQCIRVLDATYQSMSGGRDNSRYYIIEIKLKNNERLDFSHIMMGNEKLNIEKTIINNLILLKAFYFPNVNAFPTVGLENKIVSNDINFDAINLYYKKKSNPNLKKKRIKNWKIKEQDPNQRPQ